MTSTVTLLFYKLILSALDTILANEGETNTLQLLYTENTSRHVGNAVLALGLTPAPDRAEEFPMWEGHLAHSIGGEEEAFISPTLHNGNP